MTTDRLKKHDEKTGYYPYFDWLRAVAASTVVLSHSGVIPMWNNAGDFAVQVFFALSGWLIGGILLDLRPADLPRFFFNRAIRIWIPYFLTVTMLLTISVFREPITAKWIEFVTYIVTFVYNFFGPPQLAAFKDAMPQKGTLNHLWSVNVEEQFYLVAPLLLVLAAAKRGRSILLWVGLALAAAALAPEYIAIVLGVISAMVVRRYGPIHESAAGRAVVIAVLLVSIYGLTTSLNYHLVAPITGLCIVLILAIKGRKTAAGTIAGGMSYQLYLNHWIGFYAAHGLMKHASFWVATAFSSGVSLAVAISLYWFLDRQLLRRRSGWFTTNRGLAVATCAYLMIAVGVTYGISMSSHR